MLAFLIADQNNIRLAFDLICRLLAASKNKKSKLNQCASLHRFKIYKQIYFPGKF
jgi:hypothetical protein